MRNVHGSVHVDVGPDDTPCHHCDQAGGEITVELSHGDGPYVSVYLTGTPSDLAAYAARLLAVAVSCVGIDDIDAIMAVGR